MSSLLLLFLSIVAWTWNLCSKTCKLQVVLILTSWTRKKSTVTIRLYISIATLFFNNFSEHFHIYSTQGVLVWSPLNSPHWKFWSCFILSFKNFPWKKLACNITMTLALLNAISWSYVLLQYCSKAEAYLILPK